MYSNSLARHFSSKFHAKCLLPRLDRLLPARSCLQNFYQCRCVNWHLTFDPSKTLIRWLLQCNICCHLKLVTIDKHWSGQMESVLLFFILLGMWQVDLFLMKAQWSQTKDTLWLNEPEKLGDLIEDFLPLLLMVKTMAHTGPIFLRRFSLYVLSFMFRFMFANICFEKN